MLPQDQAVWKVVYKGFSYAENHTQKRSVASSVGEHAQRMSMISGNNVTWFSCLPQVLNHFPILQLISKQKGTG